MKIIVTNFVSKNVSCNTAILSRKLAYVLRKTNATVVCLLSYYCIKKENKNAKMFFMDQTWLQRREEDK